jgi:spermidine synthase
MAFVVLLMVFLSGFTGLIYQVTWHKYLSIYLGSHALSTSLTLSCFFLFLALGYHFIGRYGHKLGKNRILTYGYIEGIIGVYAIVSPSVFLFLYNAWPSFPSDTLAHFVSSLLFALLLMGLPTFLMGGTIPLLTQGMSQELQEGHRVHAWVYGINTFGAFAGTLIGGGYLHEHMGLAQSLNLTGILNCLICVFLIVYCKYSQRSFEGYVPDKKIAVSAKPVLLTIAFLSGVLSFGLESLIIRMANLSVGSSNYTYTMIVASFVICIAIGSVLSAKSNDENGHLWLRWSQLALVASLCCLCFLIPHWPDILMRIRLLFHNSDMNFSPYWITVFFFFLISLAVPVILLGMTLPLLFQQLKKQGQLLSQTAGTMYAYNSLGAGLGAVVLGYLVFYFIEPRQTFGILIFIAGINTFLVFKSVMPSSSSLIKFTPVAFSLLMVILLPSWDDEYFIPGRFLSSSRNFNSAEDLEMFQKRAWDHKQNQILFTHHGVNTYTVVSDSPQQGRSIYVNAKPDANTKQDSFTRTLTGLIPLSLAKKNEDIFIVGLGAGLSTGIAASFEGTKKVRVSEISKGVIEALPYFEKWNFDLKNNMSKVQIINDDAYKVLKNEKDTYDLIFSEPSNLWVSGVEKIYTHEFLQAAASKLRPHGIYSQWFPLFSVTDESFLSILKNFKSAFKHVSLWSAGGLATIIIASHEPIEATPEMLRDKAKKMPKIYESINLKDGANLLVNQVWPDQAIAAAARASTLEHSLYHPTLAFQSGRAYFLGGNVNVEALTKKLFVQSEYFQKKKAQEFDSIVNEEDQLIWQKFESELPEDFFKTGIAFYKSSFTVAAGKLSIAHAKYYNNDYTKGESIKVQAKKRKMEQYKYLVQPKNKDVPKPTVDGLSLSTELFNRFIYLKEMREKPQLSKVTQTVPQRCITLKDVKPPLLNTTTYNLETYMESHEKEKGLRINKAAKACFTQQA